jgi:hypothetical protein
LLPISLAFSSTLSLAFSSTSEHSHKELERVPKPKSWIHTIGYGQSIASSSMIEKQKPHIYAALVLYRPSIHALRSVDWFLDINGFRDGKDGKAN